LLERERDRQRDRERETERQRERDRERDREIDRDRRERAGTWMEKICEPPVTLNSRFWRPKRDELSERVYRFVDLCVCVSV
jgi:hypothetical protein